MVNEYPVSINVQTSYLRDQSSARENRHAFAYTVTINNHGTQAIRLLSRHWIITDANEQVQEVQGEGVVGEQPLIEAGASYCYTSGALLETPAGTMEGSYQMLSSTGESFNTPIELFSLVHPEALH